MARQFGRHQFQRLAVIVLVVLQAPAFQPRAAVRENGDDVRRLDANIALLGGANQWRCAWRRRGCERLARGTWCTR